MARPHLHAATETDSAAHESTELAASARVDAAASGDVGDVDWKTIARRERKRQQRQELLRAMTLDERKRFIQEEGEEKSHQAERMQRAMDAEGGRVKLAIDLRYDSIMNDKELNSLCKQLKFVYGSVKMMREPFQLRLFHCSAPLKESLARFSAGRWLVHWHDGDELTDVVPASSIVYLSPDSPNVLSSLEADKMYVIGGIVDKSRKKGATLHTAEGAGVTTARLPIQEHITERLDHILNVNTVADVLIHFYTHGDWRRALTEVLPLRKQSAVGRRSIKRQQQRALEQREDDELLARESAQAETGADSDEEQRGAGSDEDQRGVHSDEEQRGAGSDEEQRAAVMTEVTLQV